MDLDQLGEFIDDCPGPGYGDDFDAEVRAWLATGGFELSADQGPSCTIIAVMVDEDLEVRVFAVPDAELDEQAHRDLKEVDGKAFEWFFDADLAPEQFAGAFRICGGMSEEPDVFGDQIDTLVPEMEEVDAVPDLDFDALRQSAGSWNRHRVRSGATLPGPISHCYTARLCM